MIYSDNTYDITNNIATYTRRDFKSVFDTTSNKWYMLNNLNNYEEYGIYGDSFDTYYTGKLVIVNGREYEWNGTEWVDLGEATGEKRNVKFSEYFPDQASFTTKTINNVHWDMSRPAATGGGEDVYFSYDGPGSTSSLVPRFSMYFGNGVYTDTGFIDMKILQLSKDSDGYYYYNFSGEMYLSNYKSSFNDYLNYTTWNYAYTFINTIRYPKYYTEKAAPTISTLFASTIYRNSAHLTTLMRNDVEQVIWNYMEDDILKKGEVPLQIDYLCFEANTAGSTIALSNTNISPNIEYSRDKKTWTKWNYSSLTLQNVGDKIYMRGSNPNGIGQTETNVSKFIMTGSISVRGNIMTLIDKVGETLIIPSNYCFRNLFRQCTSLVEANISLPATTLTNGCYDNIFRDCSNLEIGPIELPALNIPQLAYRSFFGGCSKLAKAPVLYGVTLGVGSYENILGGCVLINKVISYAQNISANNCLTNWLNNVSSTGDFYNLGGANYPSGSSGIPSGWTVHTSL